MPLPTYVEGMFSRLLQIVFGLMATTGGSLMAAEEEGRGLDKVAPDIFCVPLPGGYELSMTNSALMLVMAAALIAFVSWRATRKMEIVPHGLQNFVEWAVETLYNFIEDLLGPRLTKKYFWYFGTTFILILVSNYMGLIPGVGSITWNGRPLFRGANADMNITMFLGFFFAVLWLIWSLKEQGLKHFILHIFGPKGGMTGVLGVVLMPIFILVGFIDVISICIRPIALGARLYGNIFAGESILEVMSGMASNPLVGALCMLPFLCLEVLVGFVQALVFLLLTVFFLKIQVGDEDAENDAETQKALPQPDHDHVGEGTIINKQS
ncbi:MAG: F0F1 ATP synthase subunit A [Akkermansiaceae bacterium]|nr:F0F1 ATP synthase subunit A [Akkermansiaceae bacterium]